MFISPRELHEVSWNSVDAALSFIPLKAVGINYNLKFNFKNRQRGTAKKSEDVYLFFKYFYLPH